MPGATKPYTFTPGEVAASAQVNACFDVIYNYINQGNVMLADASVAFTGTPTGPSNDPFGPNQFTRKLYVDQNYLKTLGGATGLTGNPPTGATQIIQSGTLAQVTNSGGGGAIFFPVSFPNGLTSVVFSSGDDNLQGVVIGGIESQSTTAHQGFQATINGIGVNSELIRVNWIATGW